MCSNRRGLRSFVNDIKALTGNPFLKADDFHLYNGAGEPTGRFDVAAERRGVHASKNYLILGYEDMDLREVPVGFAELLRGGVGASGRVKNILIIRDPFNLFASRFGFLNNANRHRMETQGEYVRDLWKLYAREALGRTGYLGEGLLVVKFNLWFVDPDYRRQVAESLGLAFTDQGLEAVPGVASPGPNSAVSAAGVRLTIRNFTDGRSRWRSWRGGSVRRGRKISAAACGSGTCRTFKRSIRSRIGHRQPDAWITASLLDAAGSPSNPSTGEADIMNSLKSEIFIKRLLKRVQKG